MKVGLLELDHVGERYRHLGGDYRDMFGAILDLDLVPYDVCNGELPPSPDTCDAWLATGSRLSVYDEVDWIGNAAGFVRDVREAGTPFVGVCFGHQLLAHALGGTVKKADYGWGVGVRTMNVVGEEPWMQPPLDRARLHFMHQDQVVDAPDDAVVLGCADHCEVAMFRVGERMLGVQAHPEFTVPFVEALLTDRTERIGGDRAGEALATLSTPTDEAVVAAWIAAFMRSGDG